MRHITRIRSWPPNSRVEVHFSTASPVGNAWHTFGGNRRREAGVALLLVLSILVLVSTLVIGLLISARQEVVAASAFNAGSESRLLAEMPVNLVSAQIAQATADPNKAWISQPGMIRTFTPTGQDKSFKLYSSYNMISSDPTYNPGSVSVTNAEVPADWYSRPLEYVDLNRPVTYLNRTVYPIVDPNAKGTNPDKDPVLGFDFDASRIVAPNGTAAANLLPMPVNWIYVLEDGKLVSATDRDRPKAVSRIAYWADDETSKVNVNTAAGGIYFDSPAVNTVEDHMLGRTQPIAQEYQRWPGHPATTSLSPVIKSLRDITDPVERSRQASLLTPRVNWGGSQGGKKYAWWEFVGNSSIVGTTDMDRLFTSTDEIAYDWDLASGTRQPHTVSSGVTLEDSAQKVEQLRFFLTTENRAPELNLFNRPRVTLWPFNQELVTSATSGANILTPEDRLIRLASELGGSDGNGNFDYAKRKRFYFQRKSAWDPLADYRDIPENKALFTYLQSMTSRPPPTANAARAGGAATLASKYDVNRDQILVEMWDYIRSQINTVNMAYQPAGFTAYSFPQNHTSQQAGYNDIAPLMIPGVGKGFGRFPSLTEVTMQFIDAGESTEKDSGGVAIDTIKNKDGSSGPDGIPDYVVRRVRMVLLLGFHRPVFNLLDNLPRFQIEITNGSVNPFNIDTSDPTLNPNLPRVIQVRNPTTGTAWATSLGLNGMGFPGTADAGFRTMCYVAPFQTAGNPGWGGTLGLGYSMFAPNTNATNSDNIATTAQFTHTLKVLSNRLAPLKDEDLTQSKLGIFSNREDVFYPYVSDIIEIRLPQKSTAGTNPLAANGRQLDSNSERVGYDFFNVLFKGGTINITMYPGLKDSATALSPVATNWQATSSANYLWKTSITFADAVIPLPRLGPSTVGPNSLNHYSDYSNYYKRDIRSQAYDWNYLANVPSNVVADSGATATISTVPQMDVFRAYDLTGSAPLYGDLRISGSLRDVPPAWWMPYSRTEPGAFHGMGYIPPQMKNATVTGEPAEVYNLAPNGAAAATAPYQAIGRIGRLSAGIQNYTGDTNVIAMRRTVSPLATASARVGSASVGDFSLGFGDSPIGALVVGPDAGASSTDSNVKTSTFTVGPYFTGATDRAGANDTTSQTDPYHTNFTGIMFSPFKQAPSPVIFGTLPSRPLGVMPGSWETLLFCPEPAGGRANHRGWTNLPRDHYFLDLFYMPVIEPYAMTDNFATQGKVNLNYQIAPFSYIKRKTPMYALLDCMTANGLTSNTTTPGGSSNYAQGTILAVPESKAALTSFRSPNNKLNGAGTESMRVLVNIDETLKAFDTRLDMNNDPFVSASEITEMPLVPVGETTNSVDNFWASKTLTGDDKLEAPYNSLYPRVTTRSNTFRVHFWVQTLNAKTKPAMPIVTGEYRGSTLIERYLDSNIKDYGTPIGDATYVSVDSVFPPMNDRYRFRQVDHHQFAP